MHNLTCLDRIVKTRHGKPATPLPNTSKKMIIANPIYDVVFKRLMENEWMAKFFIGTLLDQTPRLAPPLGVSGCPSQSPKGRKPGQS
jgi:hypothetical protein